MWAALPGPGARAGGGRRRHEPVLLASQLRCGPTSPARSSTRSRRGPWSWSKELRDNDDVKSIKIDAYVSPQVPAEYAAHKLNLLSTLSELSSLSGGKIDVDVHEIENFSEEAAQRREGLRHRAARGRDDRSRRPQDARRSSRRRVHLRAGPRRDSVYRQGHSRRVRAGSLDLHGRPAGAEEARRAEDRRAALRRLLDARARPRNRS